MTWSRPARAGLALLAAPALMLQGSLAPAATSAADRPAGVIPPPIDAVVAEASAGQSKRLTAESALELVRAPRPAGQPLSAGAPGQADPEPPSHLAPRGPQGGRCRARGVQVRPDTHRGMGPRPEPERPLRTSADPLHLETQNRLDLVARSEAFTYPLFRPSRSLQAPAHGDKARPPRLAGPNGHRSSGVSHAPRPLLLHRSRALQPWGGPG